MSELSARYHPKETEKKWYKVWESKGYFRPRSDHEGKKFRKNRYVIAIPPPNVTGILHMGHALNNSIQDILIRWRRMKGDDVLWVPGTDHAGIATQNVVEKKIAKEKKTRHELGREKFLKQVWKWKEEHGNTITSQLRCLGCSCDWSRERFTMDEGLSRAVLESFIQLYERNLIYQGHYIIHWCPRCETALSDEEAAHKEVQGALYHIKYPIQGMGRQAEKIGDDHIVVATTRPETMLGDTAVAVHPQDARYQHLIGKKVILPLMEREIPVIQDEHVDPEFGTGVVKITPAHDPNDFEIGNRHQLERINVMHPNGVINENGKQYAGMDRFKARKKIVEDLESQGLFIRRDSHLHAVGHCYRCDSMVEPYLSKQWFVRMKPMAEKALKAHKEGKTVFYPERWTKVYTHWLEGIRDWCISRQIWWGHQIPVWYDEEGHIFVARSEEEAQAKARDKYGREVSLKRDPDVLDTWFSSWLWPFSILGWPEKAEDLKYFYPTSDLVTAPEIIFFWVARMIMAGLEFLGEEPFNRIYIHGTVRAQSGLKMSKSLGNAIDPLEVIEEIGADALRFSMIMLSAQDVYLSREKFEVGRNFTNKLWNATRFVLMNLDDFKEGSCQLNFEKDRLSLPNRWILSRLNDVTKESEKWLDQFGLSQATTELYHFVWNDFCDWFIELAKPTLMGSDQEAKRQTQKVLFFTLERMLRLLHPVIPFITEEIWQKLRQKASDAKDWPETIMLAAWPKDERYQDAESEKAFCMLQNAVTGIRDLRARLNIPPSQKLDAVIHVKEKKQEEVFATFKNSVEKLSRVDLTIDAEFRKNKAFIGNAFADFEVFIRIEGIVDPSKETLRISKKIEESKKWVAALKKKLDNENFVKNAPEDVVEREQKKLSDAEKLLKSHQEHLALFQ
ncbi:MAG: valine--tRNA ligase [Candidatus Omnitrophica bacterium]|nr:valine--tRNA ligase [Candidatus Omnitrophota bacterium]